MPIIAGECRFLKTQENPHLYRSSTHNIRFIVLKNITLHYFTLWAYFFLYSRVYK